jgi:DNA-directed RNA polymerase beta' subunit
VATRPEASLQELSELSHQALRLPINVRLSATHIVPLDTAQIRARAPAVVTKPETVNYRTMVAEPGGLFDPELFGPDSEIDAEMPAADELVSPTRTRFARITLPVPMLHPLFAEHLRDEIARRIGWQPFEISRATTREPIEKLVTALETSGLGALVLRDMPVLPTEFRGLIRDGERFASLDTVDLYRRISNRSNRLARLYELGGPDLILSNEYVMLGEAIHCLFENDEMPDDRNRVLHHATNKPLRSIRSLCPPTEGQPDYGTVNLWRSLKLLESHAESRGLGTHDASIALPFRLLAARAVMFAMGFDLQPKT